MFCSESKIGGLIATVNFVLQIIVMYLFRDNDP